MNSNCVINLRGTQGGLSIASSPDGNIMDWLWCLAPETELLDVISYVLDKTALFTTAAKIFCWVKKAKVFVILKLLGENTVVLWLYIIGFSIKLQALLKNQVLNSTIWVEFLLPGNIRMHILRIRQTKVLTWLENGTVQMNDQIENGYFSTIYCLAYLIKNYLHTVNKYKTNEHAKIWNMHSTRSVWFSLSLFDPVTSFYPFWIIIYRFPFRTSIWFSFTIYKITFWSKGNIITEFVLHWKK